MRNRMMLLISSWFMVFLAVIVFGQTTSFNYHHHHHRYHQPDSNRKLLTVRQDVQPPVTGTLSDVQKNINASYSRININNNNLNADNNKRSQIGTNRPPSQPPPPPPSPSIEQLLNAMDNNFTGSGNFPIGENDLLSASPLFSNYYLPTATGSLMPIDLNGFLPPAPAAFYAAAYQPTYYRSSGGIKPNRTTSGLGRRIGELVTTSAEKASRAFKSFPKLLNDIKPSRLLGLGTNGADEQAPESSSNTARYTPGNISAIAAGPILSAVPSPWHMPPVPTNPLNTWSSFAPAASPPATSSVYFQQPVFVRTGGSQAAPPPEIPPPVPVPPVAPPSPLLSLKPEQLEFYSETPKAPPPSKPSAMFSSSSTGAAGQQNLYPNDLVASAQTPFGSRVKPPSREYPEFDGGSSSEEMPSSEQEDPTSGKMGNDVGPNDGPGDMNRNNDGPGDNWHGNGNGHHSNNHQNGNNFDEYSDSMPPDFFQQHFNPDRLRYPKFHQPGGRSIPGPARFRGMNHRSQRPFDDDMDGWYNSFFGPNVKPMSRFRAAGFGGPFDFGLNPAAAASNPAPTAQLVPLVPTTFYPLTPAPARPNWPYAGYFPAANFANYAPAGQAFYRPTAPTAAAGQMISPAASMIRQVAVPYYPTALINQYYMQRYRALPFYGFPAAGGPPAPLLPTPPTPAPAATAAVPAPIHPSPAWGRFHATPYSSLMSAASSLYPVRVPFPHLAPHSISYNAMLSAALPPPVIRSRMGGGAGAYRPIWPSSSTFWKRTTAGKREDNPEKAPESPATKQKNNNETANLDKELAEAMFEAAYKDQAIPSYYIYQPSWPANSSIQTEQQNSIPEPVVLATTTSPLIPLEYPIGSNQSTSPLSSVSPIYRTLKARHIVLPDDDSETVTTTSNNGTHSTIIARRRKSAFRPPATVNIDSNEWKPIFKPK